MTTIRVVFAKSFLQKTRGLLFYDKAFPLLLKTRGGIHTLLMKFPIDVLVLDTTNTIVEIKQDLKPNHFFFWNPVYDTLVELPKGTIKKEGLKVGEKIDLTVL